MNGLFGAALTFVVGAALLLLSGFALLAVLRGLLNWGRGGMRLGCVLVFVLFILWLVSGLAAGSSSQPSGSSQQTAAPARVVE